MTALAAPRPRTSTGVVARAAPVVLHHLPRPDPCRHQHRRSRRLWRSARSGLGRLGASVLIHAATNLQNDVGDFRRGADGAGRIGPPRATTEGWLPAAQVQVAVILCFALAFVPVPTS
jgi:hypothetical protein